MAEALQIKDIEVLYVEDDDFVRENTTELLKKLFKEVYVASNGKEGVFAYNDHAKTVGVIITDVEMANFSGIDMARVIHKMQEKLGVFAPIIAVSAYSQGDYNFKDVTENFRYYIQKPIRIKDLILSVEQAILEK